MVNNNQSYRINTNINEDKVVTVNLTQEYDCFDILSLKINGLDNYKKHNSKYGVIVGRVLANNGFGVPNAKISLFISADSVDQAEMREVYGYSSPTSKNSSGVRYNLLPDEKVNACHQVVGTFPNKRFLLDNDVLVEVFDKYYKYTTRTNNSGDYMLCCVPTGEQTIHMDLDLSDCGVLSQRPRDLVYKGYSVEQFENPNQFKEGTEYTSLSQVISQDQVVYVQPFWGNESLGETIGITRADISVYYKFEPTCVFIGSIVSDKASQGISKRCIPTQHMGAMDELVTGKGRIEMIRKTMGGSVEEFQIKGSELINGDGIWCYQIPMNLDYMCTDEYGNMVPTDNPNKGIPTRARVRFRMSMEDMEANTDNYFRAKILVPHNPQNTGGLAHEDYDYEFGTYTREDSFRDLFWNNVYTVKSYIPRFQKRKLQGWKEEKFTGFKHCQDYGSNNPIPYNNIRIRLPFMFTLMCILIKVFIKIVAIYNRVVQMIGSVLTSLAAFVDGFKPKWAGKIMELATSLHLNVIEDGLCPDLENWYFAPLATKKGNVKTYGCANVRDEDGGAKYEVCYDLIQQTMDVVNDTGDEYEDKSSVDYSNDEGEDDAICLTFKTDYLISCIEMNLAQEYKVINFDFYNDWINGLLYFPRWMRYIRPKRKFAGFTIIKSKVKSCMDNTKIFAKSRRYVQLCSLRYEKQQVDNYTTYSKVKTELSSKKEIKKSNNYHKKRGFSYINIFGTNGGICHERETFAGQYVYYLKPCEWKFGGGGGLSKINLFATDLVLLGSLNECDIYGVPQAFKYLSSTSYVMPTNLALTNMETNGPLYAFGDSKTFCSKNNQSTKTSDDPFLKTGVNESDQTLTSELHHFSGGSENYDLNFNGDDIDTIPMTEAAGISWNYTGPAQGKINESKLYYPGGHFLGLSCVNSQTNIKSCINLERICEQGVVISQRKTDVRAVENSFDGLKYVYTVPSGFISKDEIMDDDFRIMFATMNNNRLVATKLNPNTGYRTYDFSYVSPNNFSGEFSKYSGFNTPYNTGINVNDESDTLAQFGIVNGSTLQDYDSGETQNTQVMTREYSSVDYYRFRLGLDYDEMSRNSLSHKAKFGMSDGLSFYLPQYNNSFYFYFGLNPGSTAIDEFNKQFFSECGTISLIDREPNLDITVDEFDLCAGSALVTILTENIEPPFSYAANNGTIDVVMDNTEDSVIFLELNVGEYEITIRDSNGVEIIRNISVATDLLKGTFTVVDFNYNTSDGLASGEIYENKLFAGGYVICENIFIDSSITNYSVVCVQKGLGPETGEEVELQENLTIFEETIANACILDIPTANQEYDIYVGYQYGDCGQNYILATTCTVKDTSTLSLTIGPVLKDDVLNNQIYFNDDWWVSSDYLVQSTSDTPHKWNIRKSITNAICSSAKTTSSYVSTNSGMRYVFGPAQNTEGVYTYSVSDEPPVYINEYNTPPGYNVDDEYFYYPSYGIQYTEDIRQYNSCSYDGKVVFGTYHGIVSGSTGIENKAVVMQRNNSKLRHCQGCVFKALPSGNIYPAMYTEFEDTPLVGFFDYDEIHETEKYGIVYPTIVYPSINKKFRTNFEYFFVTTATMSRNSVVIEDRNLLCKIEGHIYNGLTYNKRFSGESYILMSNSALEKSQANETVISAITYDLFGTSWNSSADRDVYLTGFTSFEINTDDLSIEFPLTENAKYSIVEGYPMYKNKRQNVYYAYHHSDSKMIPNASDYRSVAQEATLDMGCSFYDNIKYYVDGNQMKFIGVGDSDDNIEYYVVDVNDLLEPPSTLITAVHNERHYIYTTSGAIEDFPLYVWVAGVCEGIENSNNWSVAFFEQTGYTGNQPLFQCTLDGEVYGGGVFSYPSTGFSEITILTSWVNTLSLLTLANKKFTAPTYHKPSYLPIIDYHEKFSQFCDIGHQIINGVFNGVIGNAHGVYVIGVKRFQDDSSIAYGSTYKIYSTPLRIFSNNDDEGLLT